MVAAVAVVPPLVVVVVVGVVVVLTAAICVVSATCVVQNGALVAAETNLSVSFPLSGLWRPQGAPLLLLRHHRLHRRREVPVQRTRNALHLEPGGRREKTHFPPKKKSIN